MIKQTLTRRSNLLTLGLTLLCLSATNSILRGQRTKQPDTDTIPVPGVEVVFLDKSVPSAKPSIVTTDVNGKFKIPAHLVGGRYSITLRMPKDGKITVDNRQVNMSAIETLTVMFNPKEYSVARQYLWDVRQNKAFEKPANGSTARTNPLNDIAVPLGGSGGNPQPTEGAINTSRSNIKNTS